MGISSALEGVVSDTPYASWRRWQRRLASGADLTPVRIALAYTTVGFAALFLSDVLLVQYVSDPLLSRLQALKGFVEVALTALYIYVITSARESQLRGAMARLDQQNERLQVLYRVLRHNLRNDLNVIQGYTDHIRGQLRSDRFAPECERILDTVEKMSHYTEQANRIKNITDGGRRRPTDLTETIPDLVDEHPLLTDDVDVSMALPPRATVEVDGTFENALRELLANAVQHNDAATPRIEIDVEVDEWPERAVEIRIADDGPGIPEPEREALREGREDQLLHLSGLGLWFVKWTVDHCGGEIGFEDSELGGTTVVCRVPKAPESLFPSLPALRSG